MSATMPQRMTADEFIEWAMQQPEHQRYELVAGVVVAMSPERVGHGLTKFEITRRMADAIDRANLPCKVHPDGVSVRVDATTVYEPDALVRCGPALDDNAVEIADPMILVEVVSPSSVKRDAGAKLEDYFRIPSVRHYLIVKTENKAIIHHRRDELGEIRTSIVRDGTLRLDPPGIEIENVFG